jgi:hypothetical protein
MRSSKPPTDERFELDDDMNVIGGADWRPYVPPPPPDPDPPTILSPKPVQAPVPPIPDPKGHYGKCPIHLHAVHEAQIRNLSATGNNVQIKEHEIQIGVLVIPAKAAEHVGILNLLTQDPQVGMVVYRGTGGNKLFTGTGSLGIGNVISESLMLFLSDVRFTILTAGKIGV